MKSAEKAINFLNINSIDCILMDINLGENVMSGTEALNEIRAIGGYESIPIIAVTAYSTIGDKERFLAEGFNDYISKPVDRRRILGLLDSHLNLGYDLNT